MPNLGPQVELVCPILEHPSQDNSDTSDPERSTHKYAGGIAQTRVKNMTTRHESRRPSPKAAGPKVPVENLLTGSVSELEFAYVERAEQCTHDRMFEFAESHMKKILMKCVSVLSTMSTGRIPVE
jgi:hypothetical protein